MSETFTVPTFTVNSLFAIAVPASTPITMIIRMGNPNQNVTENWTNEANLDIGRTAHQIWISNSEYYPVMSGIQFQVT